MLTYENIADVIKLCKKERLVLIADEVYQENIYQDGVEFHSCKKVLRDLGVEYDDVQLISIHCAAKGYYGEYVPSVCGHAVTTTIMTTHKKGYTLRSYNRAGLAMSACDIKHHICSGEWPLLDASVVGVFYCGVNSIALINVCLTTQSLTRYSESALPCRCGLRGGFFELVGFSDEVLSYIRMRSMITPVPPLTGQVRCLLTH